MLHEILLSLSGHPSPLLRSASSSNPPSDNNNPNNPTSEPNPPLTTTTTTPTALLTPPERALLSSLAHLSELHIDLLTSTAHITTTHPSVICRAVAAAVDASHLAAFRRKVRAVEETLLRQDAALVGAYGIVPLTAVVVEFGGWARRLEWLRGVVEVVGGGGGGAGGGGQSGLGLEASRRPGDLVAAAEAAAARASDDSVATAAHPAGEGAALGRRRSLEELVPSCNEVGRFQVLGESHDAAFVCDYCEGFIVWPDLSSIPSERMPLAPTAVTGYPHWQAKGVSADNGEEKVVVFAPLAIANHMPPELGGWQAGLICPYCEEDTYLDEGEDSSELKYVQDEGGFPDLEAFRAHLEWYHTAMPVPPISSLASALPSASNCSVM